MHRFTRWQPLLSAAGTEEEIIRIINEYLATLQPDELALLPPSCRIPPISNPHEIGDAAVTLSHADLKISHEHPGANLLHEMAHTFAFAQNRLRDQRSRWLSPSA